MAKIIYKNGMEGQNKLSCIEGIEIDLINGQKALIYPKYAKRKMLEAEQISEWKATIEVDIEALKVEDTNEKTEALLKIGSPAAKWVSQFKSDNRGVFCLPSLLSALETREQMTMIDAFAKPIEGADRLRDYTACILSCSRNSLKECMAVGGRGNKFGISLIYPYLVVPTILYR